VVNHSGRGTIIRIYGRCGAFKRRYYHQDSEVVDGVSCFLRNVFLRLLCSPRFNAIYIINFFILTGTCIAILSYGFFHMQDDFYHTFDSDPRNKDLSYTSVLKHTKHIYIDKTKKPNARA
jgi:hypothetical protein